MPAPTNNKKSKAFQGRESFHRMNYLYQASMMMAGRNKYLSSAYGTLCKNISKKTVLRLHPDIKRSLCKKCGLALKPGVTAEVDVHQENETLFQMECGQCGFKKNFVINEEYNFWLDNPESVVETIGAGVSSDGKVLVGS